MGKARKEIRYKEYVPQNILDFEYISPQSKDLLGYLISNEAYSFIEFSKREMKKEFSNLNTTLTKAIHELEEIGVIVAINPDEGDRVTLKVEKENL